jgi:hypothetical protein
MAESESGIDQKLKSSGVAAIAAHDSTTRKPVDQDSSKLFRSFRTTVEQEGGDAGVADFKRRHFTAEVILLAVRWYLMFPVSYRNLEVIIQTFCDRLIISFSAPG